MSKVKAVFAVGNDAYEEDFAFGYQQGLPWGHCKEDLQKFKAETANSVLIMGANTFTSLPGKLSGRVHCVMSASGQRLVTKNGNTADYIIHGGGLSAAIDVMKSTHPDSDVCIIGGKGLLLEAINNTLVDELVITHVYGHRVYNAPAFKRDVSFSVKEFYDAVLKYGYCDFETIHIHDNERVAKLVIDRHTKKA